MLVKDKTGSYAVLQVAVQHTLARQLSTAQEHEPNLLHCDRHTWLGPPFRPHVEGQASNVAVDVCIANGRGEEADWCDNTHNISSDVWRAPTLT